MALVKRDNNMQQEEYLRRSTYHFKGIKKPLKYGPTIDTLQDLISALHREFETNFVNIEMVNHIMLVYKSNAREWQKFAKFDRYKYTRNLVDEGNGKFNLMLLCWGEGHGSAIHDHADSHCFMKMLQGELTETRYAMPLTREDSGLGLDTLRNAVGIANANDGDEALEFENGELAEMGRRTFALNDVAYINDNLGLHRVENPSHTNTAVSLHLYCPPFNACSVFQKNSGKKVVCPVTFWSKYGVRQAAQ